MPRVLKGFVFMADRVVLLLDGGFVKKKLQEQLNHFPTVASKRRHASLSRSIGTHISF